MFHILSKANVALNRMERCCLLFWLWVMPTCRLKGFKRHMHKIPYRTTCIRHHKLTKNPSKCQHHSPLPELIKSSSKRKHLQHRCEKLRTSKSISHELGTKQYSISKSRNWRHCYQTHQTTCLWKKKVNFGAYRPENVVKQIYPTGRRIIREKKNN